ncbi:hypothetical protein BHE74_00050992, partial [Ensete ventricosum]
VIAYASTVLYHRRVPPSWASTRSSPVIVGGHRLVGAATSAPIVVCMQLLPAHGHHSAMVMSQLIYCSRVIVGNSTATTTIIPNDATQLLPIME